MIDKFVSRDGKKSNHDGDSPNVEYEYPVLIIRKIVEK